MLVTVYMKNGLAHVTHTGSFAKALNNVRYKHYPQFTTDEFLYIVSTVRADDGKLRVSGFLRDNEMYVVGNNHYKLLDFTANLFTPIRTLSSYIRN